MIATCVRMLLAAAATLLFVILAPSAWAAVDVERVVSPGGIEAWLVRDTNVPVLSIEFAFDGGAALDPEGKEGLANLLSAVLDEGAGEYDSEAFQSALRDNSIRMSFDAGRDAFFGSLKTLNENRDLAVDLARLALTEPRFDPEPVARMKNAIEASLRRDLSDPQTLAGQEFARVVFPDHPYGRPVEGTPETVTAITADDLRAFVRDRFARDTLTVGVSGDITPEALGPLLDELFGALPRTAGPVSVPDIQPAGAGETVVIEKDVPQSVIVMGHEGIRRDDPDWFPALIMNYTLGGGGFGSRLMEEIREKRGLSYGVYSYLNPLDHAALIVASGSTVNERAGEMMGLMVAEWARMAQEGITPAELELAKTYLTGSYPLQFNSTDAIAGTLVAIQRENLGIDYINRRNDLIEAVTLEDVNRVAAELLKPERLAVVVAGRPGSRPRAP